MKWISGIALACIIIAVSAIAQSNSAAAPFDIEQEHTKWIDNAMRSMQTVKIGMTRAELLMVFTTEGGLSTTTRRTYVYRHCPYIKVDVKFAAASAHEELPTDRIVEISRPYLDWSVMD